MNLLLNGSPRKGNCYRILSNLKNDEDILISLSDKDIKYCIGCSSCVNNLEQYCVLKDDMIDIYEAMSKADKIIIATPVYMNHITGILKNVIDRWNPYSAHEELLVNKKIYIIAVGQMDEEENQEIADNIKDYFESLGEFMNFETIFLKYFSSGDIETINDVTEVYDNYENIIKQLKQKIEDK